MQPKQDVPGHISIRLCSIEKGVCVCVCVFSATTSLNGLDTFLFGLLFMVCFTSLVFSCVGQEFNNAR